MDNRFWAITPDAFGANGRYNLTLYPTGTTNTVGTNRWIVSKKTDHFARIMWLSRHMFSFVYCKYIYENGPTWIFSLWSSSNNCIASSRAIFI